MKGYGYVALSLVIVLAILAAVFLLEEPSNTQHNNSTTISTSTGTISTTINSTTSIVTTQQPEQFTTCGNWMCLNGEHYISYGVQIPGLQFLWGSYYNYDKNSLQLDSDPNLYSSVRHYWHGNTVAVKIASVNLFRGNPYPGYNATYLADIDQIVNMAHQQGLNVLLTLQYQKINPSSSVPSTEDNKITMPQQDAINFWKIIAAYYSNESWVWFDVFNEPYFPYNPNATTIPANATNWYVWRNGGTFQGTNTVGMQSVVDAIRGTGAQNLVFVDGLNYARTLKGLPTRLLSGTNIAYAIHPYFNPGFDNAQAWTTNWGNATAEINAPVIADEWNEWQSSLNQSWIECNSNGPQLTQQLFSYLAANHIGLIGYQMSPGLLIRNWNWTNATQFESDFPCTKPQSTSMTEGAGQYLINYFGGNDIYAS